MYQITLLWEIRRNGKSLDYRTKTLSKMMSSNEIVTLINDLGLDPKTEEIEISGNILWTIGIPKLPTLFNLKLPGEKPDLPKKTVLANFITNEINAINQA